MTTYTSFSPQPQEDDQVQFSHDKHFALHGKILLLSFLTIFFVLFAFVLLFPCMRKRFTNSHDGSGTDDDFVEDRHNTPSHDMFRRRIKEDVTPGHRNHQATMEN
ncbi:hypothetical protein Fmac_014207 [Flemingia macrophylla]|uniref:Transmembrane protein n=1 Tax=Flemingia macrophylla TaxID=520843 RepID=A0ABD1MB23_9FABA